MRLVESVVNGYHATVIAYGQTGSGKTYTMEGYQYHLENGVLKPIISDNYGLVQRCAKQILQS
jgi:excinuclease UvrABC helicase subunit UvrB